MYLKELEEKDVELFIRLNQDSFQKGYEAYFGRTDEVIIPREDILRSLNCKGSKTFLCCEDDIAIGGVCVVINENNSNELHLLFVNPKYQSKGVGYFIWKEMEKMFSDTKIWHTCTPYFDRRNIHFYVNKCKFHIIEYSYVNEEGFVGDGSLGMFEFKKIMK